MRSTSSIPLSVWGAYIVLVVAGVVVGLLSGAGLISGVGLAVFILGSLAVFIPWAVWQLDPNALEQAESYREAKPGDEAGQ
jgi:hypothetical protein